MSVLLCARDAEATLGEALGSLLAQSFRDFECLVVDDGSTDRSGAILADFAARDPRVSLRQAPAPGLSAGLRALVEQARGELVARMDADDVAHPERFARQVAHLDRHPELAALGCDVLLVDPERRPIRPYGVPLEHDAIVARLLQGEGGVLPHPSLMARRAALLAVGSYRSDYSAAQDLDLYLRLAEHGRLANLPELLLEYRLHPGAVSELRSDEQQRCAAEIVREARTRRGLDPKAALVAPRAVAGGERFAGWSRAALGAGHRATARHYAWSVFRARPHSPKSWALLCRALLGVRLGGLRQALEAPWLAPGSRRET